MRNSRNLDIFYIYLGIYEQLYKEMLGEIKFINININQNIILSLTKKIINKIKKPSVLRKMKKKNISIKPLF